MNDGYAVQGYACIFNALDLGEDIILPQALRQLEDIEPIKMLYQHDHKKIIGRWHKFRVDDIGLWVEGDILPNLKAAANTKKLIQNGLLDGLSIGFKNLKSHQGRKSNHRYLALIELWEISIVTFPMQPHARLELKEVIKPQKHDWAQKFRAITS